MGFFFVPLVSPCNVYALFCTLHSHLISIVYTGAVNDTL
jgi:hypothetical protein